MIRNPALALALFAAPIPALAQEATPGGLALEHRMMLRCSAAFALVAKGQSTGSADTMGYPPLEVRGREFFVRSTAKVMEDTGMSRAAVTEELTREAQRLVGGEGIDAVMPACLAVLDQTVGTAAP